MIINDLQVGRIQTSRDLHKESEVTSPAEILLLRSISTMPLDLNHPALHILPQPTPFHLLQYPPNTSIPSSLYTNPDYAFCSVIKTPEEISIVVSLSTPNDEPLKEVEGMGLATEKDGPWKALRVRGPMELSMSPRYLLDGRVLGSLCPSNDRGHARADTSIR